MTQETLWTHPDFEEPEIPKSEIELAADNEADDRIRRSFIGDRVQLAGGDSSVPEDDD